jgi:hypothetical protein
MHSISGRSLSPLLRDSDRVAANEYYISLHYLLFVTLCGQFCSWVNKA